MITDNWFPYFTLALCVVSVFLAESNETINKSKAVFAA